MSNEELCMSPVTVTLDDSLSISDNNSHSLIDMLKLKIRTTPIKAFSMNFIEKEQIDIPTSFKHADFIVSYRYNCLLLGFGLNLVILDRKSKIILRELNLKSNLVCLTVDDEANAIYMMTSDEYVLFLIEKYELSSFLNGEKVCIWSEQYDFDNPYGFTVFNLDKKNRILIVCECSDESKLTAISCENGKEFTGVELPKIGSCSSICTVSDNEFIAIYTLQENSFIEKFQYENGKFNSILSECLTNEFQFRCHSLVYDRVSEIIYFSDYSHGNIHVARQSELFIEKKHNVSIFSAMCLDQQSGELLILKDGNIRILE